MELCAHKRILTPDEEMEGQFEFLIESNEYVTNDAPDFVKNAWKKAKQDKKRDIFFVLLFLCPDKCLNPIHI